MDYSHVKLIQNIFVTAKDSILCGQIWSKFEIIEALVYSIVTCKYVKDPIKTAEITRRHSFPLWELSNAMETRVLIRSCPTQNAVFPLPQYTWLRNIRITCPCDLYPLTPHFYIAKLGVYRGKHYFLIFALKHRLWVLVRTASLRRL